MKVLVADLLGSPAQEALLRSSVSTISQFADVTLAATVRYHDHHSHGLSIYQRLLLPEFGFESARQYLSGLDQIRKLVELRRHLAANSYDHIVILSYETITFSLLWNRKTRCWLINHTNLNELCHCRTRRLLFRRLDSPTRHLVFCEEFADMLRMKYDFCSEVIPYPMLRRELPPRPSVESSFEPPVKRLFVPSRHGCRDHGIQLRDLALSRNDMNVIMRGDTEFASRRLTICRQFTDYHDQIAKSDIVLCAGEYHYRVSTVAFDALSAGKPILMWDGPFANFLRRQFPSLIKTISSIDQIPELVATIAPKAVDFEAFQQIHDTNQIADRWQQLLCHTIRLYTPPVEAAPATSRRAS